MKLLAKIGNKFIDSILEPLFGFWWPEITFILVSILFIGLLVLTIVFGVKSHKYKMDSKTNQSLFKKEKVKTTELTQELSTAKNDLLLADSVKTKLQLTENELKGIINEKNELVKELSNTIEEKDKNITTLSNEITQLKEFKKRSDAARKGVKTRQKNKEEQKNKELEENKEN